jgi:RNA recognition motif-containing protein
MTVSLYVGNLASTTAEDTIRSAFTSAGFTVKKVLVMRSPQNDRSRGFGFVEFETLDEAEAAIRTMTAAAIDGRPLKLGMARERPPSRTDGRSFQSYSGLGGGTGPRRPSGGARRKTR